jgi:hypothetical protein
MIQSTPEMKKMIIKTLLRFKEIFGKASSGTYLASKKEYSKKFFLNAMNNYECRSNLEFNK